MGAMFAFAMEVNTVLLPMVKNVPVCHSLDPQTFKVNATISRCTMYIISLDVVGRSEKGDCVCAGNIPLHTATSYIVSHDAIVFTLIHARVLYNRKKGLNIC
jgi:hypothetical protein